jgi:hypothetical protein
VAEQAQGAHHEAQQDGVRRGHQRAQAIQQDSTVQAIMRTTAADVGCGGRDSAAQQPGKHTTTAQLQAAAPPITAHSQQRPAHRAVRKSSISRCSQASAASVLS